MNQEEAKLFRKIGKNKDKGSGRKRIISNVKPFYNL